MKLHRGLAGVLVACAVAGSLPAQAGESGTKTPLIIGMAETMLLDVPDSEREILAGRIASLMKEFTGLTGQLKIERSPSDLAKQLEAKTVQLGVFQGVEYARLREAHPSLKPLMMAAADPKEKQHLFAQLLVRKDSGAKSVAELKGKNLAYPIKSKEHSRLFMERHAGGMAKSFFKSVVASGSAEKALDALLEGKVDGVIADKNAVGFYRRIKPGAFAKIEVAQTSEAFPAGVLVYSEGAVAQKTLDQVRTGMPKANKSERGQDLMADWGISSFEPVFKGFQADLDAILKAYPSK